MLGFGLNVWLLSTQAVLFPSLTQSLLMNRTWTRLSNEEETKEANSWLLPLGAPDVGDLEDISRAILTKYDFCLPH